MSFKVYSITHLDNLIYIGSTKKSLNYRFSAHKICERTAIGRFIKEQGEENFKINLIKECDNATVMLCHERNFIREFQPEFNIMCNSNAKYNSNKNALLEE